KATVSGGKPPYTYHWIANRPPSVLLLPNAYERTVDVRCNVGESDGNKTSTRAWCRVKDSTGYEVSSNPCTVTFTRYYVTDLSASLPESASANCYTSGGSCDASKTITCSPTGGKPPYTYAWAVQSGGATISG